MVDHGPVQTSAVYLLGQGFTAMAPPSPPSPPSPVTSGASDSIEDLCLDEASSSELECDTICQQRERVGGAVHVLKTEAVALHAVTQLYSTDAAAQKGFHLAVEAITRQGSREARGKVVVMGVGKSGHIGKKLVATFNSLGIHAQFLHPTEALHGDLGLIGPADTLLVISFSGKTQELLLLLPHLDPWLPLVLLTSHTRPDTCELMRRRQDIILLPAPIHEPEAVSFGLSAPTSSTTVALAVGDALAIVASRELHHSVAAVFAKNHPGGAIGASFAQQGH